MKIQRIICISFNSSTLLLARLFNLIALRKAKIVCNLVFLNAIGLKVQTVYVARVLYKKQLSNDMGYSS